MTDLREIGPTYYFAPPRVFENQLTDVMIRMEDASRLKQWMFQKSMAHAKTVGPALLSGLPVSLWIASNTGLATSLFMVLSKTRLALVAFV